MSNLGGERLLVAEAKGRTPFAEAAIDNFVSVSVRNDYKEPNSDLKSATGFTLLDGWTWNRRV